MSNVLNAVQEVITCSLRRSECACIIARRISRPRGRIIRSISCSGGFIASSLASVSSNFFMLCRDSQNELSFVDGLLNVKRIAAIACERGTFPRTFAQQIASTYQKLGVSSRRELLALFT